MKFLKERVIQSQKIKIYLKKNYFKLNIKYQENSQLSCSLKKLNSLKNRDYRRRIVKKYQDQLLKRKKTYFYHLSIH